MTTEHQLLKLRRRLIALAIALSVLFVGAIVLVFVAVYQGHGASLERQQRIARETVLSDRFQYRLCRAQNHSNDALRQVLDLAKALSEHEKNIAPEQRREAIEFYKQALMLVPELHCTKGLAPPTG